MKLDERLRDTLHRRAAAVDPSSDGWIAITRRIERHRRRAQTVRVSLVAGLSVAAVAVAVAVVTLPGPDTGRQDVAATGGSDRSLGPTTTYSPFAEAPIDGRETTGPPPLGTTPGPGGGLGETGSSGPTTVPGPAGMAATTPDHRLTPVWPETRAEIDRLQTAVAEGHQPWWNDPAAVAAAYLDDRGLSSPEVTEPSTIGDSGALRYSAGGLGGWVSLSRLFDGSVYYVDGSRSDRILEVRLARHGDSLAVKVLAGTSGQLTVRTKEPGSDWNGGATEPVLAGEPVSLTVDGAASSDLIVQVRHQGDDGLVGLSETHFPSISDEWSYESLHDGSVLRIGGLGVVGLGMPLADAERWGGIPMAYDRGEHCTTLSPVDRPPGVSFISTRGEDRVDVITVEAPGVRTREGIGVGSTEAEVRQAYPGAEERGGPGLVLVLRADPGRDEMVFRIVDGEVASIWSGADGLSLTDELCA